MLLRRSATLVTRLGAAGSQLAATAAAESGGAAPSAAALQVFDRWQQHGGQGGGSWASGGQHSTIRHLSLWPGGGSSSKQEPDSLAAASENLNSFDSASSFAAGDAASSSLAAAAAAPTGGMSELFSAASIVAAAAGAEGDAIAAAHEDSWLGTNAVQWALTFVHQATGLDWWQSIMVTTLGMRLCTLPVMILQIKNTYRMSQVRWRAGSGRVGGRLLWGVCCVWGVRRADGGGGVGQGGWDGAGRAGALELCSFTPAWIFAECLLGIVARDACFVETEIRAGCLPGQLLGCWVVTPACGRYQHPPPARPVCLPCLPSRPTRLTCRLPALYLPAGSA